MPHALHSFFFAAGPVRHSEVFVTPQFAQPPGMLAGGVEAMGTRIARYRKEGPVHSC